jgi:hypothetical protein
VLCDLKTPAIDTLLANLEKTGNDADKNNDGEAASLCIRALVYLLPIETKAAGILADLGRQYERNDILKELVPEIVEHLGAIQNRSPESGEIPSNMPGLS